MPTDVIDLGYYSPVYQGRPDPTDNSGFNYGLLAAQDAYFRDIHNRIKFQMEGENGGNNWSVGRIFRWTGLASYYAYGCVITHLESGSPTGKEFLFVLGGARTDIDTTARVRPNEVFEQNPSGQYIGSHMYLHASESQFGFLGVHYHKGGLLGPAFTYDVGAGNDFDAPATSPYTDKANFFPSTTGNLYPRGASLGDFSTVISYDDRVCMVFNHEKPFIGIYRAVARNHFIRHVSLVGDLFIPRLSTDTYTAGGLILDTTNGAGGASSRHGTLHATFQDDQGNQMNSLHGYSGSTEGVFGWVFRSRYVVQNQPRPDGTYDRDRVKIMERELTGRPVTYDKGYIDPDIVCCMGANLTGLMNLYDSPIGKSLKLGPRLTIPWADGYPIPFSGWPLNPQRKYLT